MSQITRCPSCATTFKVVPDQLRISDGWVRCGQCQEVFDASQNLLFVNAALAAQPQGDKAAPLAGDALLEGEGGQALAQNGIQAPPDNALADGVLPAVSESEAQPFVPAVVFAGQEHIDHWSSDLPALDATEAIHAFEPSAAQEPTFAPLESARDATPFPVIDGASIQAVSHASHVDALAYAHSSALPSVAWGDGGDPSADPDPTALPAPASEAAAIDDALPPLAFPEIEPQVRTHSGVSLPHLTRTAQGEQASHAVDEVLPVPEVSFVVDARRRAFWKKPWVRILLALVFLLLLTLLGLQVAVHHRDELVLRYPVARTVLEPVCQQLGCQFSPVRHIDDLVIESSSFNKGQDNRYMLSMTVKSRASIALAMPAVEVTLTDAQDQPVVRRVLLPADVGAPAALGAQAEWHVSIPVTVSAANSRIAGYRLIVFYP